MTHGNAIRDCNGIKNQGCASIRLRPFLRRHSQLVDMYIAGCDFTPGAGDTDHRLLEIFICKSYRPQQRPIRRTVHSLADDLASNS
ncbi:hypothetical protein D3C73_1393480 [compost metagenome]